MALAFPKVRAAGAVAVGDGGVDRLEDEGVDHACAHGVLGLEVVGPPGLGQEVRLLRPTEVAEGLVNQEGFLQAVDRVLVMHHISKLQEHPSVPPTALAWDEVERVLRELGNDGIKGSGHGDSPRGGLPVKPEDAKY